MEKHLSELNLPPNERYLRRNWLYAILTAPVIGGIANWRSIYEMFFPEKKDFTPKEIKDLTREE